MENVLRAGMTRNEELVEQSFRGGRLRQHYNRGVCESILAHGCCENLLRGSRAIVNFKHEYDNTKINSNETIKLIKVKACI
jgi:hypothetical protein